MPRFEDAAELAARFRFEPGFPLGERLDEAAGMYLAFREQPLPTARERKERLQLIAAAAKRKDRKRLDALLEQTPGGLPLPGAPFDEVLAQAKHRPRPPVPGDAGLRILVHEIRSIWREGTGRRPTITDNAYATDGEPRHTGPFFTFMQLVVERIGVRHAKGKKKGSMPDLYALCRSLDRIANPPKIHG